MLLRRTRCIAELLSQSPASLAFREFVSCNTLQTLAFLGLPDAGLQLNFAQSDLRFCERLADHSTTRSSVLAARSIIDSKCCPA